MGNLDANRQMSIENFYKALQNFQLESLELKLFTRAQVLTSFFNLKALQQLPE